MSSPHSSNQVPLASTEETKPVNHESEMLEANHNLPARTMADEDRARHDDKDDAATMATSKELEQTTISDRVDIASEKPTSSERHEDVDEEGDKKMPEPEPVKARTPEPSAPETVEVDEDMRDRISSPKKKRGRDQDDDARDVETAEAGETTSSVEGVLNGSRTTRSGPEKKRPRDTSNELTKAEKSETEKDTTKPDTPETTKTSADTAAADNPPAPGTFGSGLSAKPQTSSSAFASSGFASLASSTSSPFGSLAASKPSVFGGNTTTSGFGALASGSKPPSSTSTITTAAPSADKPTMGFAFGSGNTSSGFGGLGSGSVFGSALGNGFAGGSGPKLSSFAAPVKETPAETKPLKAFGAPDSDEDEGSDEEDSEGGTDSDEEEGVRLSPEEKRKTKNVKVEDGESSEATLLLMRAKLFALTSKEAGWKERGVGTLKVNVPKSCVSYDENGHAISGSFDISGLDDEDEENSALSRVPRLIMRQENTHRVILNTVITRIMEFRDKPTANGAQVMFTAFEGDQEPKPVQMLLRISEANARLFKSEVASIQREL